ncbi:nuclear pore complex protein Nup88 isoform X2 [Diachasma alloeum]|uniref:nuclear pore complex protein Nup88 isoform X2 n=1 Tax=Diachasma alloeum TaxID=454923 RepID=UPI0007381C57|nr:nuclear pore complex protein Nup88 isoform X2 [Diachasma alloeum]
MEGSGGGLMMTLKPTDPPIFEITHLLINETATQLALWGNLGIVVVELPRRWGKDNAFQGGKKEISCVNHNLTGYSSQLASTEVRRVRWHPGSANNSHLLVLTSENTFQLYECESGETTKLIRNWKVGPTPSLSSTKIIANVESLGETAVDFDFATPIMKLDDDYHGNDDWHKIQWPILVLRGDGDVLMVHGNILSGSLTKPDVLGALTMYPPVADNYGLDSCSIMCIPTTPPVVVIATTTGKLYHALLMREPEGEADDEKSWSQYGSTYSLHTPDDALFVFEEVEMELGLLFTATDKKYRCPINLHRDKGNKLRYFCSHNAGIHMVTLPMITQLEEYVNASEENADLSLPSSLLPSSTQYLLCTRTKYSGQEEATPVLGFGLLQQPCSLLIALLYSGVIVDLSVVDRDCFPKVDHLEPAVSSSKKMTREPFDMYIRNLLKHDSASQPITKLGTTTKLSGKEYLELLYRATHVFRSNYFVKHDKVRAEIAKKVRGLKDLKNHQLKELDHLMETRKDLQGKAEQLAERYEDIKDKQEELAKRAEEVLRLVNYKELSSAERADATELKDLNQKVSKELAFRLEQLKKKVEQQRMHMEAFKKDEKKNSYILSAKQEEAIKSNIGQMGKSIANMIAQVKALEDELDI